MKINVKLLYFIIGISTATITFGGCSGDDDKISDNARVVASLSALIPAQGCEDVLTELKKKSVKEMEQMVDTNLEQAIEMIEYGGCYMMYAEEDAGAMLLDGAGAPAATNSSGAKATEYSTTNLQVVGVDEADFVKNDDSYIYIVADGSFQIIDAWPAAESRRIAVTEIEGTPKKLYVHNDVAVIYSSLDYLDTAYDDPYADMSMIQSAGSLDGSYENECTYGYNCDFSGDGRALKITTLDISDKTNPVVMREIKLNGSYLNSRRIDDIVYTVVTFPEVAISGLEYWPQEMQDYFDNCWEYDDAFPYTEAALKTMFARLKTDNRRLINKNSIADYLPSIKDRRYIDGEPLDEQGLLDSCDNFYVSQAGDGRSFLSLVSFEMDEQGELGTTTIVGKPGAVYASSEALYVAVRHYASMMDRWYFEDEEDEEATTVHKFGLSSDTIDTTYLGSGAAKGRILNQFSMDELNGYLRIATTMGHVPDPNVYSTLSVLAEDKGELKVVGIVDNIAPTEDIRSVRFNGEAGFIVTFKKTDPLFVIDLSDPEKPIIKGELKIPGYATYMHLMDDEHLLTIGYDADDQGSFAWFQGIQLRILDVSDIEDPFVVHEEPIGTRGSTSEAATNHLAFNYFPERDLLALPMTICEGNDGGGSYGDMMTFSGLLVYRLTVEEGFTRLGGVPHKAPETEETYTSACSNWWTDSNSVVQRSIFMSSETQDFVYSIAYDLINVSDLEDLENPLVGIELASIQ